MAHVTGGSDKPIRLRARPILSLPPCPTACLPAPVFIAPCLPSTADHPPAGPEWVHEIKHDGYRVMARRDPVGIRLLTRNGHDWADRYPLIVEAVNHLKARSCLIDGEAVCCNENGLAVFERMRRKREGEHVFLYAFDLLELDGTDLRQEPFEVRKSTLSSLLRQSRPGLRFNEHLEGDGPTVFAHACKMALEGRKRIGESTNGDKAGQDASCVSQVRTSHFPDRRASSSRSMQKSEEHL